MLAACPASQDIEAGLDMMKTILSRVPRTG